MEPITYITIVVTTAWITNMLDYAKFNYKLEQTKRTIAELTREVACLHNTVRRIPGLN